MFGTFFTIVSNYFGVKMPVYVKDTVDQFMANNQFNSIENILILSVTLGGIYMLLSLLKGFFLFLMRQTIIVMSRFIEFDLKNEIFTHYQQLDTAFYKNPRANSVRTRLGLLP